MTQFPSFICTKTWPYIFLMLGLRYMAKIRELRNLPNRHNKLYAHLACAKNVFSSFIIGAALKEKSLFPLFPLRVEPNWK